MRSKRLLLSLSTLDPAESEPSLRPIHIRSARFEATLQAADVVYFIELPAICLFTRKPTSCYFFWSLFVELSHPHPDYGALWVDDMYDSYKVTEVERKG